jgi:two-component system, OmpR family, response regulator
MHTAQQVLVVDDDNDVRELVAMALSSVGYEVMSAPDGAAALELLATSRPAVILLDMSMPNMNGWEFARLYEQRPGWHAPIIVLTAGDTEARAAEIKADGWLAKPFSLAALVVCVKQHAG